MKQYHTHVCLVSGQAAPNLLPLLDDTIKPKKVELIVTPQMKEQAKYLTQIIKPRGISVSEHELDSAADYDAIQELLLNIVADNEEHGDIALNVTGGTKWMAIAAQEVFRSNEIPVFYVDLRGDALLMLGKQQQPYAMSQSIGIKDYLGGYGYTILNDDKPRGLTNKERELCQSLIGRVSEWEQALGQLNLLAATAADKNTLKITFANASLQQPDKHLQALLATLKAEGMLIGEHSKAIEFSSEAARTFANGGWLESYVNSLLNSIKSEGLIQDSPRLNLEICSPKGSKNELDVAFMARNHLHIVECKTKNIKAGQAGSDTLYKLDSLSELGGLATRAMLVSFRKLRPADKQRAEQLGITVVEGQSVQRLKEHLKEWIKI